MKIKKYIVNKRLQDKERLESILTSKPINYCFKIIKEESVVASDLGDMMFLNKIYDKGLEELCKNENSSINNNKE